MNETARLLVQLLASAGVTGLVFLVLTMRQQRRKIDAGATNEEANAASTLSGAALKMVTDADNRAGAAEARAASAWVEADTLRRELVVERGRVDDLERRERDLEAVIRELGGTVPPARRAYDQRPTGGGHTAAPDPEREDLSP